jgi:hypothetical protein
MTQFSDRGALEKPVIDPRHGDVETDFSSTKQHSMLSLAGGLLVEISLPLIMARRCCFRPGLLLASARSSLRFGFGPRQARSRTRTGFWSTSPRRRPAIGYFGWRALFRLVEGSFWALNSVVVHGLRHEKRSSAPDRRTLARRHERRWRLRARPCRRPPDLGPRPRALSRLAERRAVRHLAEIGSWPASSAWRLPIASS